MLLSTRERGAGEGALRSPASGAAGGREAGGRPRLAVPSRFDLLERVLREILLIEVRRVLGGYPFTIGIVLAYFILKGEEIRRIMTVLNAKAYDWPQDRILSAL